MNKDDPVVTRVREARQHIVEQCGHSNARLMQWAKQIEEAHRDRVVSYERPGSSMNQKVKERS